MPTEIDRRSLLALLALPPLAMTISPHSAAAAVAKAGDPGSSFLRVSRIIAATNALTQDVADKIEKLLMARDDQFKARLKTLDAALSGSADRTTALSQLSSENLQFAVEIAKPWYTGFVGTPSNSFLKDDAEFATFLEAQAYQKIIAQVPRQSYPPAAAGWWGEVPEGVKAPKMPAEAKTWAFKPTTTPAQIQPPDPQWLSYVKGTYHTADEARAARPSKT